MIKQRATEEKAVLVALQLKSAAIDDEFAAFFHTLIDEAGNAALSFKRDYRAHFGIGIRCRADFEGAHFRCQGFDQLVSGFVADRNSN